MKRLVIMILIGLALIISGFMAFIKSKNEKIYVDYSDILLANNYASKELDLVDYKVIIDDDNSDDKLQFLVYYNNDNDIIHVSVDRNYAMNLE